MIASQLTQQINQPQRRRPTFWHPNLLYVLLGVWVLAVLAFNIFKPIKVLPRIGLAPGFVFTNQVGERKTSEDYRGKVTIYNFTYSQCAAECSQTTTQMDALRLALAQFSGQGVQFSLVTISIDPAHDTPDVLHTYSAPFLANQGNEISWDFLSGEITRTKYVVGGGFSVYYKNIAGSEGQTTLQLDPRFVLVDGWGIIRAEYRTAELNISTVLRDIGYLEAEIQNSKGVGRFAYEAAHLFRCYP